MKTLVRAGTDAATLCAFDPAALPADIDARLPDDPAGLMENLRDTHRLWFAGTGGDGTRRVLVSVDELPAPRDADPDWRGTIDLPSGSLWVCGAEYLARDPRKGSAATPKGGLGRYRMGRRVAVPPGRYALDVTVRGEGEDRPGDGSVPSWLTSVPLVLVLFGGLGVLVTAIATVAQLVVRTRSLLAGTPAAGIDWSTLPPVILGMAVAGACVLAGLRIGRIVDSRLAAADRSEAGAGSEADIVLALRRIGEAGLGRAVDEASRAD